MKCERTGKELVCIDVVIKDFKGNETFRLDNVETYADWGLQSTEIAASKYFRSTADGKIQERSVPDMIHRVVEKIRLAGVEYGYFSEKDSLDFYATLFDILANQKAAFNSPVWFNVGCDLIGMTSKGRNFAWNPEKLIVEKVEDAYKRPQGSACFIQSVEDDLEAIFELCGNESKLFKNGSGTGTNFSNIRGEGEPLSNGGTSSGVLSFLNVLDAGAGATKSGGGTRRAAKMVVLNADHPEIFEFVKWKSQEENKAKALISAGYDSDYRGEAYRTVGGQNSNNSVRVTDSFMKAVENDSDWSLVNRTGGIKKTVKARALWSEINSSAWSCADPGLQFDTTANKWHTIPSSGRINASNPCSEYFSIDDSACNLASVNLVKYFDGRSFDYSAFSETCKVMITAQDILVSLCSYPTKKIAENAYKGRQLGLGFANIGGLLMLMGIPYDSKEARSIAAKISSTMTASAYLRSGELAKKLGASEHCDTDQVRVVDVLEMHRKEALRLAPDTARIWDDAIWYAENHGIRNSQATVIAPTGTIGFLMGCATTGIEPDFSLMKIKKLVGGGVMMIANPLVKESLLNLGYSEDEADEAVSYLVENNNIETWSGFRSDSHIAVFTTANTNGERGTRFISPYGHLEMMAAVQPFVSGAISKTVNVPNETIVEEIASLHMDAWKMGLKAVAVYRDGCKSSQPLNSAGSEKADLGGGKKQKKSNMSGRINSTRLEMKVAGKKIFLHLGRDPEDGKIKEVFADIGQLGTATHGMVDAFCIAVSIALQNGASMEKLTDKFKGMSFEPSGVVVGYPGINVAKSLPDLIFRVIEKEGCIEIQPPDQRVTIAPPAKKKELQKCDECGAQMEPNGTCHKCPNCGSTSGCS